MASSIGALTFMKMEGPQIPSLASAMEIIDRSGVDGTGSRENALKAEDITKYTTEGVTLLATANSAADDYALLKGTYVAVTDDTARTVTYVLVIDVRVLGVQQILNSDPVGNNYLVRAVWLLKPTL